MQSLDENSDRKPVSDMYNWQDLLDKTTKTVSVAGAIRHKQTAQQAFAMVAGTNL
jgi:hypothetical protein